MIVPQHPGGKEMDEVVCDIGKLLCKCILGKFMKDYITIFGFDKDTIGW